MSKITYKLIEHDGRYYFNDGTGFVLVDTGFYIRSHSLNGKIGPFGVSDRSPVFFFPTLQAFLRDFLGPAKPDGESPKAILYPLDFRGCLLEGDSITIDNSADELPEHDYFLPFIDSSLPIIKGKCNGKPMRFYFDTGMRMAVIDNPILTSGKISQGTVKEWIPPVHRYVDTPYYSADFELGDGFQFRGYAEYDNQGQYINKATNNRTMPFDVFFGNEIFKQYNLFISSIPGKRGIAIITKSGKSSKKPNGKTEDHISFRKPSMTPKVEKTNVVPTPCSASTQEKQLKRICQNTDEARRIAIEHELLSKHRSFRVLAEGTLVVSPKNHNTQDIISICAHYDVIEGSQGYNDNGMSIASLPWECLTRSLTTWRSFSLTVKSVGRQAHENT